MRKISEINNDAFERLIEKLLENSDNAIETYEIDESNINLADKTGDSIYTARDLIANAKVREFKDYL